MIDEAMRKADFIIAEAMRKSDREGYPKLTEEHPFFGRLRRFMADKSHWIGTATDLLIAMNDTAIQMKKLSQSGKLDSETIERIISEVKPNQREKISFQYDELSKYFPKCSPQEVQRRMMKLAQADYQHRVRNRNRESR